MTQAFTSKKILQKKPWKKELLPKLKEERDNGKIAYLKGDKLVVKEPREDTRDKRKRNSLDSPTMSPNHEKAPKKITRTNLFDYMARGRSASMGSEKPKNK